MFLLTPMVETFGIDALMRFESSYTSCGVDVGQNSLKHFGVAPMRSNI